MVMGRIEFAKNGISVTVDAVAENIFRVRRFFGDVAPEKVSLCVKPNQGETEAVLRNTEDDVCLSTDRFSLSLNAGDLTLSVANAGGEVLYREKGVQLQKAAYTPLTVCIPDEVKQRYREDSIEYKLCFDFQQDERIYGLGAHCREHLNMRNEQVDLIQYNASLPMPFMVSSRNYGVFFDHYSYMQFNGEKNPPFMYVSNCEMADYYIICGEDLQEVSSSYYTLTGMPGLLPKFVFGYIQSKERYQNQTELVETAEHYRKIGVPLDCVVQDWQYWQEGQWGQKSFDESRFPDPLALTQHLHELNSSAIISIWPKLEGDSLNRQEMQDAGQMLDLNFYNCFSKKGREIYYRQLKQGIAQYDFDGYWTDDTEPVEIPMHFDIRKNKEKFTQIQRDGMKKVTDDRYTNTYTYFHNRSLYEKLREDYPEKRMFLLTRASFPGLSAYNTATWTGDISASWESMRVQITSLLNCSMAGEPFCHNDIGAFFPCWKGWDTFKGNYPKAIGDNEYRELYTRWLQQGAFMPIMRSHGTGCAKEIWQFENSIFYPAIEKYITLRTQLLPYIYSTAYAVHQGESGFMNPLFKMYPEDKQACNTELQYMFGDSILVCPVTRPMYYRHNFKRPFRNTKMTVYLPAQTGWYDFETGEKYTGGQSVRVNAPIDKMPLFVKEGSIIPMYHGTHSSAEYNGEIRLKIYPGKDASFTLYDDDGTTNQNENGMYRKILLSYSDAEKALTFSDVEGHYRQGEPIHFVIEIVGHGTAITAVYDGGGKTVRL